MDREVDDGHALYPPHPPSLQPGGRSSSSSSSSGSGGGSDDGSPPRSPPPTASSAWPEISQATAAAAARARDEKLYFPGHAKSLAGIATRAFLLGCVLSLSLALIVLLLRRGSPLWRLPSFFAALALFHFLEFWTTARYNTRAARVSSFLLSQNGSAYNIAHTAAVLEFLSRNFLFSNESFDFPHASTFVILVGLAMMAVGQVVRSAAMIEAATNFNHIVQDQKTEDHQLVTSGVYHYFRHPSYFGFFWWGLGTQLVLGNVLCFVGYAVALFKFFSRRISAEEELLITFFGNDYIQYRKRTPVGIPFIK